MTKFFSALADISDSVIVISKAILGIVGGLLLTAFGVLSCYFAYLLLVS